MGRTSIPCSAETQSRLKRQKEELGMDWDEYLNFLAGDAPEDLKRQVESLEDRVSKLESMAGGR